MIVRRDKGMTVKDVRDVLGARVLAGEGNKETAKGNGKTPGRTDGKKSGRPGSRMVLVFGICANLALLFYFKYTNFFIENLNAFLGKDIAESSFPSLRTHPA